MRAATLVAAAIACAALLGCIGPDQRAAEAARERYEACVARRSADHPECRAERDAMMAAQARYEQSARRAWGCNPANEECPRDRGR